MVEEGYNDRNERRQTEERKTTHGVMNEIRNVIRLAMNELTEATRDRMGWRQFVVDVTIRDREAFICPSNKHNNSNKI